MVALLQDLSAEVIQIQESMGADIHVAFDCVGISKTMTTALKSTRAGGKVCLVGMGHPELTVPLTSAAARYFVFSLFFFPGNCRVLHLSNVQIATPSA